jgi:hypothetical protein
MTIIFVSFQVYANDNKGMFLCISPVFANSLWQDTIDIRNKGVTITFSILESIAMRNKCRFFKNSDLKPIRFVAGQFLLSQGESEGWAHPDYYIRYVNGK